MNTALLKRESVALVPTSDALESMLRFSETLYKSGLLPSHIKTPQGAFAVIQKGLELGIPPMHAMSNIIVIQGKPTANAELMLALIYRDHGDNAIQFSETSSTKCTVLYKRKAWASPLNHSFSIEEAKSAGLMSNQTWQKYPKAMLRARCISAVARLAFPDSIGGMYTPEELGVQVVVSDDEEITIVEDPQPIRPPLAIVENPVEKPQPEPSVALISHAQLEKIRALANDRQIDIDAQMVAWGKGKLDDQSTEDADKLIEWLFAKPIPEKLVPAVVGFTLTKEQWVEKIGQYWLQLLDLKVYPSKEALQEDFIQTCKVTNRSELSADQACQYINTLKEKLCIAEEKIPVGKSEPIETPESPIKPSELSVVAGSLTQEQYSEIGKLTEQMISAGFFDDRAGASLFMQGKVGIRTRQGLSESTADIVIRSMKREFEQFQMERKAAPKDDELF